MNQPSLDKFTERLSIQVNSTLSVFNLWLGLKLGLFRELRVLGQATSSELAAHMGLQARYVREWLECMYVGEYLEHNSQTGQFSLNPLQGPYPLVTAFECLHDMAYPIAALKTMRALAQPDGAVLIADEAAEDSLEANRNFLGHYLYNWSVLHCLPQALVAPGAAGTGTVIRPSVVKEYAKAAGFTRVDILPIENNVWRFYRLTP